MTQFDIPARVAERAFTNCTPHESGCLVSNYSLVTQQAKKRARMRYAQIGWQDGDSRHGTTAHRAAWVHVHGQIPDGMTVDHRPGCVDKCVNVDHLRLLSNFENAQRTLGRDWEAGQCANGHPESEREYIGSTTKTRCRPCYLEWQRKWNAKSLEYKRNWRRAKRAS